MLAFEMLKALVSGSGLHVSQITAVKRWVHENFTHEERHEVLTFVTMMLTKIRKRHVESSPDHDPADCGLCGAADGIMNSALQAHIKEWLTNEGAPS